MTTYAQLQKQIATLRREVVSEEIPVDRLGETVALMRRIVPVTPEAYADAVEAAKQLPRAWKAQRFHETQAAAFHSPARFRAIEAGRRSGKSQHRKFEIVIRALDPAWLEHDCGGRRIVVGGPTDRQTRKVFWRSLIELIPKWALRDARKQDGELELVSGAVILVAGMDRPQRAEGDPIDDLFLDEFADTKPEVWDDHLRPSLSTPDRPKGSATFFGTPDMATGEHFIKLCDRFRSENSPNRAHFWWPSTGIVDEEELADARKTMPRAKYLVEYEAKRVSTGNLAYHVFDAQKHAVRGLRVIPDKPLVFAFDFNRQPGVASVLQEQTWAHYGEHDQRPEWAHERLQDAFLAIVGEVFIEENSNTPMVCRALIDGWGDHEGEIWLHGDASGRNKTSSAVLGSDWEMIHRILGRHFEERVHDFVPRANPGVRDRVNCVNFLFEDADENGHMVVSWDCPMTIRDFERVAVKKGTKGDIDKPKKGPGSELTHMCFDGGTVVETPEGFRAMRDLAVIGRVRGPYGQWVDYQDAGITLRAAPMVAVELSCGDRVRCNPWHQFLTLERGWVRADQLAGLTIASSSDLTGSKSSSARPMGGRAGTSSEAETGSTGSSIGTSTAQSRMGAVGMCTTSTETARTISRRTSNCSPLTSTCPTTTRTSTQSSSGRGSARWTRIGARLPLGIAAQRVAGGTACMPEARRSGAESPIAKSADAVSATCSLTRASAAGLARQRLVETLASTTRRGSAPSAGPNSRPTGTAASEPAPGLVVAVEPDGTDDSYCLRVPSEGCFAIAGGWVVSNSDAIGYACFGLYENAPEDIDW